MVLLGEIRHCWRILLAFTRPYLGTASSMSKTFAVSTHAGGSSSSRWIEARPDLRSRLSCARLVRISLARWSASIPCINDRSGAAVRGSESVTGAMDGDTTYPHAAGKGDR